MKLKTALLAATAFGLLSGIAYADENESFISQSASGLNAGATNAASVNQTGGDSNKAGSDEQNLTQITASGQTNNDGALKNSLSIVQTGSSNEVGLGTNANIQGNETPKNGVYQRNNYGTLWGASTNSLAIEQNSDGNKVGAAFQSIGSRVGSNVATISQDGGHVVESLTQRQNQSNVLNTVNSIGITQTGSGNRLYRVEQYSGGVAGSMNTIAADIGGSNNGTTALAAGGFAAGSGATSSSLLQGRYVLGVGHFVASNSDITLEITGSNNSFGSSQYGDNNTVGTIGISGNYNQVGTYQDGNDNTITITAVTLDGNDIGVRQFGDENDAAATANGSGNLFGINQQGDTNFASIVLNGDDNGATGLFTGAAAIGLGAGLVEQFGDLNNVDFEVISGNNNLFAFQQAGDSNEIVGTTNGSGNQVAVSQGGTQNYSFTQQSGPNNVIGVQQ